MAYSNDFVTTFLTMVDDIVSAEKANMASMLYESAFVESDFNQTETIVPGVRKGQAVPILKDNPEPDSFAFVDETSCAVTDTAVSHQFSGFEWDMGLIKARVGICLSSFNENFLRFFEAWRNTQAGGGDEAQLLNAAMVVFISDKFVKNLNLATYRAGYFSDKASGSAIYNKIDGVFTQMEANASQLIDITQNAGGTFLLQAITGEEVYNYLTAMYDQAMDEPWFDDSRTEYKITRSMAGKLVSYLNKLADKAPSNCVCIDPKTATERRGFRIEGLTLNGIPVNTYQVWDDIINHSAVLNGGGGVNARVNPHRAILTYKENVLIGTSEDRAIKSFDIWHSKDDSKVYLEGSSYIGAAVPMISDYILAI